MKNQRRLPHLRTAAKTGEKERGHTWKITNADRAKVLVQALPYIQQYYGQTIVIKYGGNAMINEDLKKAVMSDIVLMQLIGINVVLVHGGGPESQRHAQEDRQGKPFVNGLRYTDEETIDVVQMCWPAR